MEPRSFVGKLSWAAALIAAMANVSCIKDERLPQDNRAGRYGGTGVGGAALGGGGGGQTVGAELCSCLGALENPTCFACLNTERAPGDTCDDEVFACVGNASAEVPEDLGCKSIISCVVACNGEPGCMGFCFQPIDADASHQRFADAFACSCADCADECAGPTLDCSAPIGGGGGAGGVGGAWASGGMAAAGGATALGGAPGVGGSSSQDR